MANATKEEIFMKLLFPSRRIPATMSLPRLPPPQENAKSSGEIYPIAGNGKDVGMSCWMGY